MKEIFVIKGFMQGNHECWYQETNQHGIHLFPQGVVHAKQFETYPEAVEAIKPLLSVKEIGWPAILQIEKYFIPG